MQKCNVEDLDKDALLDLLGHYNNYVVDFFNTHEEGMQPVSVYEFFENEYQESKLINDNKEENNNFKYSKVGEFTLGRYNISRFDSLDEAFKFIIDEDVSKEQLLDMLSENAKKEIISLYWDVFVEEDGKYYYGTEDFCFFEDDVMEQANKINNILNELSIKNINPYNIMELIEQMESGVDYKDLESSINTAIKGTMYEGNLESFMNYIDKKINEYEIINEEEEDSL